MGRKAYIFLTFWFVVIALLTSLAYVPLSFWWPHISSYMPKSVSLKQLNGYWWDGQVRLTTPSLRGVVDVSWTVSSLFNPMSWRLSHEKFQGFGQVKIESNQVEFWVDGLSVQADMFNGLLQPERVVVQGSPIIVSRWYAKWQLKEQAFDVFRGNAQWATGAITYPMGRNIATSTFEQWQVEGRMQEGFPELVLRSKENRHLGGVKMIQGDELEVTVMPAMVEALGQQWRGSREYPAFVMIQPLY